MSDAYQAGKQAGEAYRHHLESANVKLCDENRTLRQKLEAAEREREARVRTWLSVCDALHRRIAAAEARATALAEENARLKEALKPFAEFGHERKHVWEEDFAAARRALKGGKA